MPLHDHFVSPVLEELPFDTLHSSWASDIARSLNLRWLVKPYRALEYRHVGPRGEIDIGAFETPRVLRAASPGNGGVATIARTWSVPAAAGSAPLVFPDTFEVRVYSGPAGWTLVGVVELVSPANKDRPAHRQAFLNKCASFLQAGVSLVLVDVVTAHHFNLHNELLDLLDIRGAVRLPEDNYLYAAAYRPVQRGDRHEVDVWREPCALGAGLPTMPLRLVHDLFVPIELEETYKETCRCHWM